MKEFPRCEPLIKDHTAIHAAKTCFRKYFYQIVIGRVPNNEAIYFAFGSSYHKFREVLEFEYLEKTKGMDSKQKREALNEIGEAALLIATNAATATWKRKTKGKDPDVTDKFGFMTGLRLVQSCMTAYKFWLNEKKLGKIEVLSVEQPFNVMFPDGSSTSGRADQIVRWNGQLWGRDFKTTSKEGNYYSRGLEPNDQFTRYTYAESKLSGQRVEGQIIEVLYNSKTKGPIINTYLSSRTESQINNWVKEQMHFLKLLELNRKEDVWPMEEVNCPFCPYHQVCKKANEAAMINELKANYIYRPWDNTKID